MAKIVDLQHKWATEVGRVFIAFGSIEWTTVKCLEIIPKDQITNSTKGFRLAQRIDLVQEILTAYDHSSIEALSTKLAEAKKMAESRNLIAHNPLVLDVFADEESDLYFKEKIMSLRNPEKHMVFEELQTLAEEAEVLSSELLNSATKVFAYLENPQA